MQSITSVGTMYWQQDYPLQWLFRCVAIIVLLSYQATFHYTVYTHICTGGHVTLMQCMTYQNIDCLTASPERCQVTMNQFKQLVYCSDSKLLQSLGVCMLCTDSHISRSLATILSAMHGLRDTSSSLSHFGSLPGLVFFPGPPESLVILTCNFSMI